jgi:hypothetical protein
VTPLAYRRRTASLRSQFVALSTDTARDYLCMLRSERLRLAGASPADRARYEHALGIVKRREHYVFLGQ